MNEQVTREQIRLLAYALWMQEGRPDHRAVEHWLRAEAEVLTGDGASAMPHAPGDDRDPERARGVSVSDGKTQNGSPRPAVRSGVGTLLLEEQELQSVIALGLSRAEFAQRPKAVRAITHHYVQVAAIIALLGARSQLMPRPARFGALESPVASRIRAEPPKADSRLIRRMAALHQDLARRLAGLSACDSNGIAPMLSRAAREHEEMARTLAALSIDDSAGGAPGR